MNEALKSAVESRDQPPFESLKSSENTSEPRSGVRTVDAVTGLEGRGPIPGIGPLQEAPRINAEIDQASTRIRTVNFYRVCRPKGSLNRVFPAG